MGGGGPLVLALWPATLHPSPPTVAAMSRLRPSETPDADAAVRGLLADWPAQRPLRAAAFIVTLYGDVVVPRGGTLWIGNVIEACRMHGISETLVRTAVSRLVAAGRLEGLRAGRRSFYRLTPAARREFERAAELLYAGWPEPDPGDWTLALGRDGAARSALEALLGRGFGLAAPGLALRPGHAADEALQGLGEDAAAPLIFESRLAGPPVPERLRPLAAAAWDLEGLDAAYRAFLETFGPLDEALGEAPRRLDGALALAARLLLVHAFRLAALSDPQLPAAALPDPWSGRAARRLFARLYRALSPAADAHIAARFVDADGPLAADAAVLDWRLAALHAN